MHQSPLEGMLASLDIIPLLRDNAAANGAILDMQGWDGVVFLVLVGATDIEVDFAVQEDSDSAFGSGAAITGAAITQLGATDDDSMSIVDVWRPTERYVRGTLTVGDGVAGSDTAVVAMRYRGQGTRPVVQDAATNELVKVKAN